MHVYFTPQHANQRQEQPQYYWRCNVCTSKYYFIAKKFYTPFFSPSKDFRRAAVTEAPPPLLLLSCPSIFTRSTSLMTPLLAKASSFLIKQDLNLVTHSTMHNPASRVLSTVPVIPFSPISLLKCLTNSLTAGDSICSNFVLPLVLLSLIIFNCTSNSSDACYLNFYHTTLPFPLSYPWHYYTAIFTNSLAFSTIWPDY